MAVNHRHIVSCRVLALEQFYTPQNYYMINLQDIIESVIDPKQPGLSKHVFKNGKLLPDIRFKILRGWSRINKIGPTGHILVVGSIGTLNYSTESDVDITIKWLGPIEQLKAAQKVALSLNGKDFAGPHEINYFVRPDANPDYFDAIYDVLADRWIKGPAETGVNVDKYMQRFEEVASTITTDKAELLSDIADYHALDKANDADRKKAQQLAEKKLDEIETDVNNLGDQYLEVKASRNNAFQETDLNRIKEYGRRNALPENVIYLLLRRYCYLHFLNNMHKISDDGIQKSELDDVEDAFEDFNTCRVVKGFEEAINTSLAYI